MHPSLRTLAALGAATLSLALPLSAGGAREAAPVPSPTPAPVDLSSVLPLTPGASVQKLTIHVPAEFDVRQGDATYPLGFGSGLEFAGVSGGDLVFLGITDRGPNLDGPGAGDLGSKIFPAPSFSPCLAEIHVRDGVATVVRTIPLKAGSKAVTGLPVLPGSVGFTGEKALSLSLEDMGNDPDGLDTEAIRIDPVRKGTGWICDEYGPFVIQADLETGKILRKLAPGSGLPEVIARRQPNRGMEGLAVTASGKILAGVQSILDLDGKVKKSKATFLRFVWIDPDTGATRTYAYPHDVAACKASADAKLGDLVAIPGSETRFLVVEQGEDKDGNMRNLVYLIDTSEATDISGIRTADGREPEFLDTVGAVEALGVRYIRKTLLADLRALGWTAEKAEGIAILDKRRFAVISDNDFGVATKVTNPVKDAKGKALKPAAYQLADGKLLADGVPTDAMIVMERTDEAASFFLVTTEKPFY